VTIRTAVLRFGAPIVALENIKGWIE
jgi:hypothetical protein